MCPIIYKKLAQACIIMSAIGIFGRILQYAGIAVMFFGFALLIINIQKTVGAVTTNFGAEAGVHPRSNSSCDTATDPTCGVDLSKQGAMEEIFARQSQDFFVYLGAGLGITFLGLLFRVGDEVGGFFGSIFNKNNKTKIPIGKMRWREPGEGIGGFGGAGFGGKF